MKEGGRKEEGKKEGREREGEERDIAFYCLVALEFILSIFNPTMHTC